MIPEYVNESHKQFWPQFENWCNHNGVGENCVYRKEWWNCFLAGLTAMYLAFKQGNVE